MTGCLEGVKQGLVSLHNGLPAAINIIRFVGQVDVVDKVIKCGELFYSSAYVVSATLGVSSLITCECVRSGNLWRAAGYIGVFGLYGYTIAPAFYFSIRGACAFARSIFRREEAIKTGCQVNNSNVKYNQRARGRIEQSLVLLSKIFVTISLAAFTYATYVGAPVSLYQEFFVEQQSLSNAIKKIYMIVTPILLTACSVLSLSFCSEWLFNKMSMKRSRREGLVTFEDEVQYKYDQKRIILDLIIKILESIECFIIMNGFSILPNNSVCLNEKDVDFSSIEVDIEQVVQWQNLIAIIAGFSGSALCFLRAWMEINPPEFTPPVKSIIRV